MPLSPEHTDALTRANGGIGTGYTTISGTTELQIVSNALGTPSNGVQYGGVLTAAMSSTDHYNEADMTAGGGTGTNTSFLLLRSGTAGNSYYVSLTRSGAMELARNDSGTPTSLGTASLGTGTFNVRIEAIGTTISVYVNDNPTPVLQATGQTNHASNTGVGWVMFRIGSSSTGTIIDNLEAGTFAAATTPVGLFNETDSLLTVAGLKTKPVGAFDETDTLLSVTRVLPTLGVFDETDALLPVTALKSRTVGQLVETDALSPVTAVVPAIGLLSETDSLLPVRALKTKTVGMLAETDGLLHPGEVPELPTEVRPDYAFGYDGEVGLSWVAPTGTIDSYVVEVSADHGTTWTSHSTPTASPTTLTGLTINQRYMFRVAAVSGGLQGGWGYSEWGCTPVTASAPITPPTATTDAAAGSGFWATDQIDGTNDDVRTRWWTGDGVTVIVVDGNVNPSHADLASQDITTNHHLTDGLTEWNNYTGYTKAGHGTAVNSCAVGLTCGLATDATSFHVISWDRFGYNWVGALEWVRDNLPAGPCIVVTSNLYNYSVGMNDTEGRTPAEQLPLLIDLYDEIIALGVAIVQCGGNINSPPHNDIPARSGFVKVGGHDSSNAYGEGQNDDETVVCGPAVAVRTPIASGSYGTSSATSFAAPLVGGAMACWLEANPNLTAHQLYDITIAASFKDTLTGSDDAPNRRFLSLADVASTDALLGTGILTETDELLPVTRVVPAVGQLNETDELLAVRAAKTKTIGQLDETNELLAARSLKTRPVGQLTETDELFGVTEAAELGVGLLDETDALLPVRAFKSKSVGILSESDTLLGLSEGPAPTGIITCSVTGAASVPIVITGAASSLVAITGGSDGDPTITGPALRRATTGPELVAVGLTGADRVTISVDGPDVTRAVDGPESSREVTGPGVCSGNTA